MAPIHSSYRRSLSALDACSGTCTLGLVIGCAAPIFIALSTFSILLIRRRVMAGRSTARAQQEEAISNGGSSFGMLCSRLSSIYVSRALVASPNAPPYISSTKTISLHLPAEDQEIEQGEKACDECPDEEERSPTPLLVLPSLASMLGDFLSYGDAIDEQAQPEPPQDKTIQRPHTPFLLKTASSEMDVKPPSIESISKISSVPTKEDYDGHFIAYMAASTTSVETPSDTRLKTNDHVLDRGMDHFASMAVEDLVSCLRSDVQLPTTIQSKPNLAVATTLWSIIVDDSSNSTLETLFPVRLEDFPSIPKLGLALAVPPLTVLENTISVSQSSLVLAFSKSMSAPASLNLLDDKLEDVPRRICFHPRRMVCVTQQYDPGQLWDEDDERKFNDAVVRGKLLRNTWTAGVLYTRSSSSGPGELWDDEDDRRMSYEVSTQIVDECLEALSTFATLSFVSLDTISISDGLGGFHKFFQSSSDVPLAGSTGGDTTMETSGSLESFASTEVLLPQKCADTEFSLFSSHSGGLCICHEVFPGSACVCDPDVSGGATIVELDDDAEPLKQDSSTGYQGVGFLHNHSQFSLSFDDIDIKSQNTSPATITTCASTRSSLASFVGLLEFDFETPEKRVVQDQMQVVDMDVEPNTDYISAISFVRLPWPWAPLD